MEKLSMIAQYLAEFQDKQTGGLQDPGMKKIIRNSYATPFYALLCALEYTRTKKQAWLARARRAVRYELELARQYHSVEGIYRWEFKNYALLQVYTLLLSELSFEEKKQFERYFFKWKNICSFQTNYTMMRALNYLLRYQLFHQKRDLVRSKIELQIVLSRQDSYGFWYDTPDTKSFQYHCYTMALLFQYQQISPDPKVEKAFLRGVDFLLPFVDPQGDCNYFGRGAKQIFGYASYIYALTGAAVLTNNQFYLSVVEKIRKYVSPSFQKREITVNDSQQEKAGWYPYNNLGDYLAFAGSYLAMSELLVQKHAVTKKNDLFDYSASFTAYYQNLGVFLVRGRNFFCLFVPEITASSGYSVIAHAYPSFIPTRGGPPKVLSVVGTQKTYEDVFFGVKDLSVAGNESSSSRFLCSKLPAHFSVKNNLLSVLHSTPLYNILFTFSFKNYLQCSVSILPKNTRKKIKLIPLHYVAHKMLESSLTVQEKNPLMTVDGMYTLFESDPLVLDKEVHYSITFPFPVESISLGYADTVKKFEQKNNISGVCYKCQKVFFFSFVLVGKLLFDYRDFKKMLYYNKERKKYY